MQNKIAQLILTGTALVGIFGIRPLRAEQIQSRFVGPLNTKVWKHWQLSWNVDDQTGDQPRFELVRGKSEEGNAWVKLRYQSTQSHLTATFSSEFLERSGPWQMLRKSSQALSVAGINQNGISEFILPNAVEYVDESEQRFVTLIRFTIKNGNTTLFEQELLPMYVRGKQAQYWNNSIDAYSAHAGTGNIHVATASAAERGDLDSWDGTLVKPVLNYIERNTLSAGASIGLHRHEANQEIFMLESGRATMKMGVAHVSSPVYKTRRQWDGNSSAQKETDEFTATGGWLESRELSPNQLAVIVPNAQQKNNVYMHGIDAQSETVFWTMGTKN